MEHLKLSLDTIAKELGVSKVTVSKALNDKEGVSEELRKKIKAKADELGYRINGLAKALKSNKAYNIGVLVPEWFIQSANTYYFEVYALLVRQFATYGYNGVMEVLERSAENDLILPRMYLERKIDGLMILGECSHDYLTLFEDIGIPVLFLDFDISDIDVDSLTQDNYYSGQLITNYLINKGHKKIGFIGNIYSTSSIKDRYLGYYRALLDAHIELNQDYIISDRNEEGILTEFEVPNILPTSYVCNNDEVAYQVVKKLLDKNIRVPEDISVVTFDNTIYSNLSAVKLTTIDTNVKQMVEAATKAIIKKINVPTKVYDRILIKGTIIERDSVKELKEEEKNEI